MLLKKAKQINFNYFNYELDPKLPGWSSTCVLGSIPDIFI